MEQISQNSQEAQPVASHTPRKVHWFILGALIIIILSIFGGGYYYLEVYYPAKYAKAVIALYDELRSPGIVTTSIQGSSDYKDVLTLLDEYQAFFTRVRDSLSKLKPSPFDPVPNFLTNTNRSRQIHADFTRVLDLFLENSQEAKKQAQFMIKVKELFLLLRPDLKTYPEAAVPEGQGSPTPPPPNTVGEFLAVWESRVPKAKRVAKEVFYEPLDLGDISFERLKSLWQETEEGLDALLPYLRKQDPRLTLSEAQKLVPENERQRFDKVDTIDEFLPLLESVLIKNSAENILRKQFAVDSPEFNLLGKRIDTAIKELRERLLDR